MPAILIVEDDPGLLELIAQIMKLEGWDVDTASTGQAAMERIRRRSYDAVVLDLILPDADGVLLHARMRRVRPHLQARTIFMTGFTSQEPVVDYLRSLSVEFLQKPFAAEELVRAVERVARVRSEQAVTAAGSKRS